MSLRFLHSDSYKYTPTSYADSYSHLESPEKVNSLERNKINRNLLQSNINELDSSVYGYNQDYDTPHSYHRNHSSIPNDTFENSTYSTINKQTTPPYSPGRNLINKTFDYSSTCPRLIDFKPKSTNDGYTSSDYTTNTYKTPTGYKTETFKYETYKTSDQPIYQSMEEKFYTNQPSLPSNKKYESVNNGTDTQYQSSYSSNVEYINEPPVFRDTDSLEQKMLKKSLTQQIVEKKSVSTIKTSKQESSTKTFGFK